MAEGEAFPKVYRLPMRATVVISVALVITACALWMKGTERGMYSRADSFQQTPLQLRSHGGHPRYGERQEGWSDHDGREGTTHGHQYDHSHYHHGNHHDYGHGQHYGQVHHAHTPEHQHGRGAIDEQQHTNEDPHPKPHLRSEDKFMEEKPLAVVRKTQIRPFRLKPDVLVVPSPPRTPFPVGCSQYQQVFDYLDTDSSGAISVEEWQLEMWRRGEKWPRTEVARFIDGVETQARRVDPFGWSSNEVVKMDRQVTYRTEFDSLLHGYCSLWDGNSDGEVTFDEAASHLERHSLRYDDAELHQWFVNSKPAGGLFSCIAWFTTVLPWANCAPPYYDANMDGKLELTEVNRFLRENDVEIMVLDIYDLFERSSLPESKDGMVLSDMECTRALSLLLHTQVDPGVLEDASFKIISEKDYYHSDGETGTDTRADPSSPGVYHNHVHEQGVYPSLQPVSTKFMAEFEYLDANQDRCLSVEEYNHGVAMTQSEQQKPRTNSTADNSSDDLSVSDLMRQLEMDDVKEADENNDNCVSYVEFFDSITERL